MRSIERTCIVIKPKQPFLDWILSVDDDPEFKPTLEEIRNDCRVLLIPEFDTLEEVDAFVKDHYLDIFEMELEGWYLNEDCWPQNRSYHLFKQWIDVEVHTEIIDILTDEYDES